MNKTVQSLEYKKSLLFLSQRGHFDKRLVYIGDDADVLVLFLENEICKKRKRQCAAKQ